MKENVAYKKYITIIVNSDGLIKLEKQNPTELNKMSNV